MILSTADFSHLLIACTVVVYENTFNRIDTVEVICI